MLDTKRAAAHSVCSFLGVFFVSCSQSQLIDEVHSYCSLSVGHHFTLQVSLIKFLQLKANREIKPRSYAGLRR
jgi:hypothetical protein